MTFTLISVVYACGIAKPGHGSLTPMAVGFSLIACAGAGGKYTGKEGGESYRASTDHLPAYPVGALMLLPASSHEDLQTQPLQTLYPKL
jgi:hypothetical protein